jgi:prolipoprotein diacylglyceryltransferase
MYGILYLWADLLWEGFRTDSLMLTPSLRAAQVISIVIIVRCSGILYYRHKIVKPKADSIEGVKQKCFINTLPGRPGLFFALKLTRSCHKK